MQDPRYPIGRFQPPAHYTVEGRSERIAQIEATPQRLRAAVSGLTDKVLEQPYREGGWTIRQVVHHVADSHINAYVRFKLAVTEEEPTIKTYDESLWAELRDSVQSGVEISLGLIDALHQRWAIFLRSLTESQFQRCVLHPELGRMSLDQLLALYAWHGRHHLAHITTWRERLEPR